MFQREECWHSYKALLDEVEIWAKWKDPLPLGVACQVYRMMATKACLPYNGLELQFFHFFEETCTPQLVRAHLDRHSRF